MRPSRLPEKSLLRKALVLAIELSVAFAIGGILILAAGANPIVAYITVAVAALGSVSGIVDTLLRTSPLC